MLGVERSTFNGAVRIYWPGFTRRSAPRRHPVWLGDRVEALGLPGIAQQLFQRVGRVSSLSLAVPDLERDLRREQGAAAASRARERLVQLTSQQATSVVDDAEWRQEYERAVAPNKSLATSSRTPSFRVLELEEELEAVRQAFAQVAQARAAAEDDGDMAAADTSPRPPSQRR